MANSHPQKKPALSVIIGIRDWEVSRLRVAIKSHQDCTIADQIEVVVSDFGSRNHREVEQLARDMGCVFIHTESEIWSRSRALNIGIAASRGDYILTTDADIIFAPQTHAITLDLLRKTPGSLQLKQCRDLPESIGLDQLDTTDWNHLKDIAMTRPRWGMGGLAACSRETADRIRGYDERMVVWGAEDNDFGKRVRAAGGRLNWIMNDSAQIYHVWHPPFLQTNPKAGEIHRINLGYLNDDPSIIRNLSPGSHYRGRGPLVSVVIATKNRAEYLKQAIDSVLAQSFEEFELIVIDDGSDDETPDLVASVSDPRVRYLRNDASKGVGASRNIANAQAKAPYIAVHDDDDIMLPDRLEVQLRGIRAGTQGVYGGWVDFEDTTGKLSYQPGKAPFSLAAIAYLGGVLLHPTLLVERRVFQRLPYHERFRAGSDYNVAFRMAWNGTRLNHCGAYVTLRRVHGSNMTAVSTRTQRTSSLVTNSVFLDAKTAEAERRMKAQAINTLPVEIPLTETLNTRVAALVPGNFYVEAMVFAPQRPESYSGAADLMLVGTMTEAGFELVEEIRPPSDQTPPRPAGEKPREIRMVRSKTFEFDFGPNGAAREAVSNAFAATTLHGRTGWIALDTRVKDALPEALARVRPVLPLHEKLFAFHTNDRWFILFEADPPMREIMTERKLGLIHDGSSVCTLREVVS